MYRFSNGLRYYMSCELLIGFRETGTHSRACDGCHVLTFSGWDVTRPNPYRRWRHPENASSRARQPQITCESCALSSRLLLPVSHCHSRALLAPATPPPGQTIVDLLTKPQHAKVFFTCNHHATARLSLAGAATSELTMS